MLIRVEIERLRPGVFVDSFDGSWLSSPFWRKRFLIQDADAITRLRDADITEVTIDTARGLGPIPLAEPTPVVAEDDILDERTISPSQTPVAEAEPEAAAPRRRVRATKASEVERAAEVVERSKEAVTAMFSEARMGQAIDVDAVEPLVDEIAASVARDPSAMVKVTRLKTKNEYTYLHSVAVCALMINLARHIGLPPEDHRMLGMAGLLHDIGKMSIPEEILDKPGRLTEEEVTIIRAHPEQGHVMLVDSPGVSPIALDVCLHHHERVDGGGYPFGLSGDQLSLHARMGGICDVYDAVTSNRPYKRAWSANDALARMLEWEGHFDEELLYAFIASIGIQPTGGLVRLASNRLGIVIEGNHDEPTAPKVRAFYDIPTQRFVPQQDIDTAVARLSDRILRSEDGGYWFGQNWETVRDAVNRGEMPQTSHDPARPYAATPRQTLATRIRAAGGSR
ncbi:HD-GYP domain-containing protein [Sphingomonas floccifaciens]|uniref:HD-GYP domain-containing protein n=1 Tax=Sphingomonas floccifaciens TaxID=1844115 RepID=A0ABW4ND38_9SPHN